MKISEAALAFGSDPSLWGARLSPDGQRVSILSRHSAGIPVATVVDLSGKPAQLILASDPKKNMNIQWCDWANNDRLLCGYFGPERIRSDVYPATRLVAVDDDGSNQQVLAQRQQRDEWSFRQDEIVDRLPNDREHILMELRKDDGEGVSSVNIYTNQAKMIEAARQNVWNWRSDGRGNLKLRTEHTKKTVKWRYRVNNDSKWKTFYEYDPNDHNEIFEILGFGDDPNKVLVRERHEGREALFSIDLPSGPSVEDRKLELIYAHPKVDISDIARIGRRKRLIGVTYSTDKSYVAYFDETIRKVNAQVSKLLPEMAIRYDGESWDRRFYLVHASSDIENGTYYHFDSKKNNLVMLSSTYPNLKDTPLSPMTPIEYPSDDGIMIPGYVSRPVASTKNQSQPTIILPHGGPTSRNKWGFDWLVQFLTARGYVVLQSNYRGSSGYGQEWTGEGAFRQWKRAMTDLEYGAKYLIEAGIADPNRICTLGWSYGGYASLMSAIEFPDRYRCAVSIAGVSDPVRLINDARDFHYRKVLKDLISSDPAEVQQGSPLRRAGEIEVPVLLFHGDLDINVPIEQSEKMKNALKKQRKNVKLIKYKRAGHSIEKQEDRIDMLEKVGKFLDKNLAPL